MYRDRQRYPITRQILALNTENMYIGPSQYYNDPARVMYHIQYPADIYEAWPSSSKFYMLNLLCDYSTYVEDFGYIPINEFIKGWTIVAPEDYPSITDKDTLYICNGGTMMESVAVNVEDSYFRDEDGYYSVTVSHFDSVGNIRNNSEETLMEGSLYYIPFIHIDYLYESPKKKGQEGDVLCPILITRTKKQ